MWVWVGVSKAEKKEQRWLMGCFVVYIELVPTGKKYIKIFTVCR